MTPLPNIAALRRALDGGFGPAEQLIARRRAMAADGIWISEVGDAALRERAAAVDAVPPAARGPLHGVPFAVKGNSTSPACRPPPPARILLMYPR